MYNQKIVCVVYIPILMHKYSKCVHNKSNMYLNFYNSSKLFIIHLKFDHLHLPTQIRYWQLYRRGKKFRLQQYREARNPTVTEN